MNAAHVGITPGDRARACHILSTRPAFNCLSTVFPLTGPVELFQPTLYYYSMPFFQLAARHMVAASGHGRLHRLDGQGGLVVAERRAQGGVSEQQRRDRGIAVWKRRGRARWWGPHVHSGGCASMTSCAGDVVGTSGGVNIATVNAGTNAASGGISLLTGASDEEVSYAEIDRLVL